MSPGGGLSPRELIVSGQDLPELFQNAALGLASLFVDPVTVSTGGLRDRLRAEGPALEPLLARWLDQVLVQIRANQMIPASIRILRFVEAPPCSIEAEIDGELLDPGRHGVLTDIRRIALRAPKIAREGPRWRAQVLFDA